MKVHCSFAFLDKAAEGRPRIKAAFCGIFVPFGRLPQKERMMFYDGCLFGSDGSNFRQSKGELQCTI